MRKIIGLIIIFFIININAQAEVRMFECDNFQNTDAGFVGYKSSVLDSFSNDKIRFSGYAFQIEMKFKSWKKNFIIKEHPIVFVNRTDGVSKMNGDIIWEAFIGVFILIFESLFNKK